MYLQSEYIRQPRAAVKTKPAQSLQIAQIAQADGISIRAGMDFARLPFVPDRPRWTCMSRSAIVSFVSVLHGWCDSSRIRGAGIDGDCEWNELRFPLDVGHSDYDVFNGSAVFEGAELKGHDSGLQRWL